MHFVHITGHNTSGSQGSQSDLFSAACQSHDIQYTRLIDTDCSLEDYLQLRNQSPAMLYRSGLSKKARSLEISFLRPETKSVYLDNLTAITGKGSSVFQMERYGLPVIPGIPFFPRRKREAQDFADQLGGFPLVIKVFGGHDGIGVLRVDSPESLNSVADYIKRYTNSDVRVMQYIPHQYYVRAVVVGKRVVAATQEAAPEGDFRGNAYGRRSEQWHEFTLSEEMERDAVLATRAIGVKTAGVDFLLTEGGYYIAEANHPFNFAETQIRTKVDIASAIVQAMMR